MKKPTQHERSQMTRQRLIDATLDCLQRYGYHGTTLSRILEKAGVSRGAWRHHFATKTDLVAASANAILHQATEKASEALSASKADQDALTRVMDYVWENFYKGRHRDVWLEFNIACRTDEALKQKLKPVIQDFFDAVEGIWKTYFTPPADSKFEAEPLLNLTLYVMRGMAIQSIVHDDPQIYEELRSQWKKLVSPYIQLAHRPENP